MTTTTSVVDLELDVPAGVGAVRQETSAACGRRDLDLVAVEARGVGPIEHGAQQAVCGAPGPTEAQKPFMLLVLTIWASSAACSRGRKARVAR